MINLWLDHQPSPLSHSYISFFSLLKQYTEFECLNDDKIFQESMMQKQTP